MEREIQLIIGLIVANWSALGIAIKCLERINPTRNILLGIDPANRVQTKEIGKFLLLRDFGGFALGMILVFLAVGGILIVGSYPIKGINEILSWLYFVEGCLFVASSFGVAYSAYRDYCWIKERIVIANGHTMNEGKSQPT